MGRSARRSYLDLIPIPDEETAQAYADIVYNNALCLNGTAPKVEFSGRRTETVNGYCYTGGKSAGRIVLNKYGENWGTLAHELAHLHNGYDRRGHGWEFHEANLEILDMMEMMIPRPESMRRRSGH